MSVAMAQSIMNQFRRVIPSKVELELLKIEQKMDLDIARRVLEANKEEAHKKRLEEFEHYKTSITQNIEIMDPNEMPTYEKKVQVRTKN